MCVKLQLFTLLLKKRNRAETNRFRCVLRNLMRRFHQTAFKNPDIYRSDANRKTFEDILTDLRAFLYSVRPFDKFGIRVVHELSRQIHAALCRLTKSTSSGFVQMRRALEELVYAEFNSAS